MSRQNYNRHPYLRDDMYWKLFGHLDTDTITKAFKKRIQKQVELCAKHEKTEYHYPKNHE